MGKPKALDLFCGGGGTCLGLQQAGFEVVGIDHKLHKNYPGDFIMKEIVMKRTVPFSVVFEQDNSTDKSDMAEYAQRMEWLLMAGLNVMGVALSASFTTAKVTPHAPVVQIRNIDPSKTGESDRLAEPTTDDHLVEEE